MTQRPVVTLRGGHQWATPIFVGAGLLADEELWRELLAGVAAVALVTDEHLAAAGHLARLEATLGALAPIHTTVLPPGERTKARGTKAELEDRWLAAGLGRDALAVALGGGVVGDLVGFTAATYLRGIPIVQVPTSVVAMVDASIGGKTAIDVPAGKNLIGAFHPPRAIVADVATLASLPEAELRHGLAEVIKHAAIADAELATWLEAQREALVAKETAVWEVLVARNVRIKGAVVEADEREGGYRQVLNFGHTVGHALERLEAYALPHGEAVAVGMVAEARMAEAVRGFPTGDRERLEALLTSFGLPIRLEGRAYDAAAVLAAAGTDKKVRRGELRYALPNAFGRFEPDAEGRWAVPVPTEVAHAAIAAVLG